jgi:uncharacterized membrane-anchored protein
MLMSKPLALAALVVGVILLIWGFSAYDSAASSVSRAIEGSPTDKAIYLLGGGALLAIAGGASLMFRRGS